MISRAKDGAAGGKERLYRSARAHGVGNRVAETV